MREGKVDVVDGKMMCNIICVLEKGTILTKTINLSYNRQRIPKQKKALRLQMKKSQWLTGNTNKDKTSSDSVEIHNFKGEENNINVVLD